MGWAEQDVSPTKLAQGAVSSYVESQGDYCTGFDYVRPYAENEYLVCAKIGEYEMGGRIYCRGQRLLTHG